MNVALFSDAYLPTKNGVVTVVLQIKQALEDLGHNVVVVTVDSKAADKNHKKKSRLRRLGEAMNTGVLHEKSVVSKFGDGQFLGLPSKNEVVEFLKRKKIDIVHAHTEFTIGQVALKAARKLNIPAIATTHTMWEDYYRYYLSFGKLIPKSFIRFIVKKSYQNFYALINVSEKAHNYYKMPFMTPKLPSAIIPNAIDTKRFISHGVSEEEKENLKNELKIKKGDRIVLYVGRVVEEKRVFELLDVMTDVIHKKNNIKMVFVGNGAAYEELMKRAEKAGLIESGNIIFTGYIDWEKLAIYYAIGDIFVTSSLSEMHSMTILEALSLGLPVVCRKDTSFSDTIFHGIDGYAAESDEELAEYIMELADNDSLRHEFSLKALEISKRFTLDIYGKRTEAFYKKVLSSYPGKLTDSQLQEAVDSSVPMTDYRKMVKN